MNAAQRPAHAELTDYERDQVREIAAWKSEPPNPFAEMFKMITLPGAKVVEQVIPDAVVRAAIERAYDAAELSATQEDIKRQAGVADIGELQHRPLEECDRLATRVSIASQTVSVAEGAATGAGGPLTTLADIPLLFILAIRTILKVGYCYGYRLDTPTDRRYVLAVLLAGNSSSLATRRERLARLREIEDSLLDEILQGTLAEEAASFLFQLEVFEEVPGAGAVSGALLNLAFIRRVDITARRVFQQRWLRDHGKVDEIEPAEAPPRALAIGWSGALKRAAYSGCYYTAFGVTFPAWLVASLFRSADGPLVRGIRDGATAATLGVDRVLHRARGMAPKSSAVVEGAPALAPA
jgi:hypothetical protein